MNTPYFQSFLAPHLRQFVQYKRALNRKYLNDAHTLRLFDRYLCNHDIADWHAIDSAVVYDFLASRPKSRAQEIQPHSVCSAPVLCLCNYAAVDAAESCDRQSTPHYRQPDSILIRSRYRETSNGRSTKAAGEIP